MKFVELHPSSVRRLLDRQPGNPGFSFEEVLPFFTERKEKAVVSQFKFPRRLDSAPAEYSSRCHSASRVRD
jgi:hypothetical protein